MMRMIYPRTAVVQYTSCELRQRVRHAQGLALLHPKKARKWRMMAYGVLLERRKARHDGRKQIHL